MGWGLPRASAGGGAAQISLSLSLYTPLFAVARICGPLWLRLPVHGKLHSVCLFCRIRVLRLLPTGPGSTEYSSQLQCAPKTQKMS